MLPCAARCCPFIGALVTLDPEGLAAWLPSVGLSADTPLDRVSERYKYVFDSSYEKELYDLEADPHEMKNVAGDEAYQDILKNMHQACRRFHEEHGDYFKWEQET